MGTVYKTIEEAKTDGSAASFWPEALPWAQQVHSKIPWLFISVILAQWASETGYGGPDWYLYNNPGNVGDPAAGGQTTFPTMQAGVNEYAVVIQQADYYGLRSCSSPTSQSYALGQSPWAAGHYEADGPPPGEDLVKIISEFDLTQYDGAAPVPVPTPTPTPTPNNNPLLEEIMFNLIATSSAGVGYVVAADLSSKTGLPDVGDEETLLKLTVPGTTNPPIPLYLRAGLTDALLNAIPNA